MSQFIIDIEPEDSPRAVAPELRATWGRLAIRVAERAVTRVEARAGVRSAVYVPLYPVAEWLVANWWFLLHEWRRRTPVARHDLSHAREGFALPSVRFWPAETTVEVEWNGSTELVDGLRFLEFGRAIVPKAEVEAEFRKLIVSVLGRLESAGVGETWLSREWRAVQEAEADPETLDFCRRAARLGCDPFHIDDATADQIERISTILPESVLDDFYDALSSDHLTAAAEAVRTFLDGACGMNGDDSTWRNVRAEIASSESTVPWRQGYAMARQFRRLLSVDGPLTSDMPTLLASHGLNLRPLEFSAVRGIDGITAASHAGAPVVGLRKDRRLDAQRFALCRAVADFLVSDAPSLLTRSDHSEHQKRNRAFAAELLVPAAELKQLVVWDFVGDDEIEELAERYAVSEQVIRHQIRNHRIAETVA